MSDTGLAPSLSTAPRLQLRLLGAPQLLRDGAPVALSVRKAWALLAYLAVEGSATRSRLAGLLWSDNDEASARRNLRRELHRLREAGLADLVGGNDVFVVLGGCRCDLLDFEAALRQQQLEPAVALYA
ncbi:MAG: AfsR family transcriptional regulator, partial [Alphaproteobacteria bacterium]|nr:AfsR family transcriptional regulator [Alphaproteobacteria bacterium]